MDGKLNSLQIEILFYSFLLLLQFVTCLRKGVYSCQIIAWRRFKLLSKPNVTQLKKQLRWVGHSTHVFPTTPPPNPTPQQTFQALLDQLES